MDEVNVVHLATYNLYMTTAPVTPNPLLETDKLLVKFEIDNIPDDYREYYGAKRHNLFANHTPEKL